MLTATAQLGDPRRAFAVLAAILSKRALAVDRAAAALVRALVLGHAVLPCGSVHLAGRGGDEFCNAVELEAQPRLARLRSTSFQN
jgi:hypothetical protein